MALGHHDFARSAKSTKAMALGHHDFAQRDANGQ